MQYNFKDLTGQKFFHLVAQWPVGKDKIHNIYWLCLCECGKIKILSSKLLLANRAKSCGCFSHKKEGTAFRNLLCQYKSYAKKHNRIFELNEDLFRKLTSSVCFYCGRSPNKFQKSTGGEIYIYNGIDRKDSSLGYTENNVVSCCWPCNQLKSSRNSDQFLSHILEIAAWQASKKQSI